MEYRVQGNAITITHKHDTLGVPCLKELFFEENKGDAILGCCTDNITDIATIDSWNILNVVQQLLCNGRRVIPLTLWP